VKRDLRVQTLVFLGVAAFIAVIAAVYWFVSYEEAGTTMLVLASGLGAVFGGWLLLQDRKAEHGSVDADDEEDGHYLPVASVWPFAVGIGAALALNGLILGWPYAIPGGLALLLALAGFVGEARRRA
jgi:hypothetical protein